MSHSATQRLIRRIALIGFMVSVSVSAYSDEARQQAMLDMQYADTQGCFIISGDAVRPVLPLLVANDGLDGIEHRNVMAALDAVIKRGCDINQPDLNGLSALNTAILLGNVELARYLITRGADPKQIITSEREGLNGRDSSTLIDLLHERAPQQQSTWQQLRKIITATN